MMAKGTKKNHKEREGGWFPYVHAWRTGGGESSHGGAGGGKREDIAAADRK